ncbi:MAG: asparagine synthase C-terminal domain-containing protein [Nitrososphaera sp.]|jgi:asparagine synthase (glutamine-hydrolysing)
MPALASPSPADLKDALYGAVLRHVPEKDVAVAFSGGVDSCVLAKICQDVGKQVTLVTVGFEGSHDIDFSKKIAGLVGEMRRHIAVVLKEEASFAHDLAYVRQKIGCSNTSHIENCIAYFYIARAAAKAGLQTVLSANGCDELFCGYNGYRQVYSGGPAAIAEFMEEKIANELVLVQEISAVAGEFGVQVKQPFLSRELIEFAKTIPLDQKIRGPDDLVRKHILREAALLIGVPKESATKPKKALQYGSLIHKHFKKGFSMPKAGSGI